MTVERDGSVKPRLTGRERGEPLEAEGAFARGAHGRQRVGLVGRIGLEAARGGRRGALQREQRPLGNLALAQADTRVVLGDLERLAPWRRRRARGGWCRPRAAGRRRARGRAAPGSRSSSQAAAIEPRKSSNARASLPFASAMAKITSESTVISGLARARSRAAPSARRRCRIVPLWIADDRAVTDRVVVGGDLRVALRVVADVEEHLARIGRDRDPVEDGARAGALLVDGRSGLRASGRRTRPRRRRARRSRPAAPGQRASGRRCSSD